MEVQTLFDPFTGPEILHVLAITESQQELWHSCLFGGEDANRAYNESLSLVLTGRLELHALEYAFQKLIERHEALRSAFSPDGKYMCVFADLDFKIDLHDYSDLSEDVKRGHVNNYLRQDAHTSFDLVNGPLIRVGLLKLGVEKHLLVITAHHIICDGWSFGIILQELGSLYSAKVLDESDNLPEPTSYGRYAEEQRIFSEGEEIEMVERFWLNLYEDGITQLNMPIDHARPSRRTYKGERFDQPLNKELIADLKKAGAKTNCSLVVTLMTAFELFLYELTGQENFALGLPTAGQSAMGAKHLIGHCVNLLPLKTEIDIRNSFVDQLQKRKSANFDAFENQQLTFGRLLKKLNIERDPSRIPLVPVVLNIDMGIDDDVYFEGLRYELKSNPREYETFELFLNATGSDENLLLEWSYNSNLFEKSTIEQMANSFELLLEKLITRPEQKIASLISKKKYSYEIKGKNLNFPNSTLHELFAQQAKISQNTLALQSDTERISYGELQKRVDQTALYLWRQGVRPNQNVAISLDRSPDLIVSIFAVLQCGAAYVPIDTSYPHARIELMVVDSDATFIITKRTEKKSVHQARNIAIQEMKKVAATLEPKPLDIYVPSEAPAYIIYTSGSTGKPKGVQVAHKNVVNLVNSMGKEPGIAPEDKIFSTTTISFDATVMEIFLPLLHGAAIVFVDEETRRDGHLMLQKAINEDITMMWGTPTIYQILLDSGWKEPLPIKALIGGEPVPLPLARDLLKRCKELWNIYGPTETTVCAFLTRITEQDDPITIGKPIANTHAYLLDENGNQVGKGEEGEIVIGGEGVSLGYLNRPELNKNSFIADSYSDVSGSKMYRSGDIGRLLPNGQVQCLGRKDRQVKIRGHRIELGEIEHLMKKLSGIQTAVVDGQDHFLRAYVVSSEDRFDQALQVKDWKERLASELPEYMVPQEFIFLEEIPVTSNGKLDRKKLEQLNPGELTNGVFKEASTEAEILISDVWKDCLGLNRVDVSSDFFELGGHSLIAARVMTMLEEKTGKRLPLASLFEHSTIEKLARLLEADNQDLTWDSLVPIRPKGNKPPIFIVHGAGLNVLNFKTLVKYMDSDQPVYGLQAKGLNGEDALLTSVEEIAAYYNEAIVSVHPDGPYALAGYSFGGIIAYEMARQLTDQGMQVNMVGLFDTYAYPAYGREPGLGKKAGAFTFFIGQKIHTLRHMFGSLEGFKFRARKYLNMFRSFCRRLIKAEEEPTDARQQRALEIMDVNKRAIDNYHLQPAQIKVSLFRAMQLDEYVHDPTFLGWKAFALKGVDIHEVPGDHYSIFSSPNDEILATQLQKVLDESNADQY